MNDYREIRADQIKVGDRVQGRGKVREARTMGGYQGNWTRIWFEADPAAPVDVPHHEIMRVESGGGDPAVVTDGNGNAHCENCGQNAVFPSGYGDGSRCPDGEPCDWRPGHTYDQPAA